MNSTTLAVIKGITVLQDDDGRVHWQSGAAVDADGANGQNGKAFSYRKDDKGLDALANAGYPNQSWRDVLVVENDVLMLENDNKPGILASIAHRLAKAKVNIEYAYGGAADGCPIATLVLGVEDAARASAAAGV